MTANDAGKWNAIYQAGDHHQRRQPARVLQDYDYLLPASGNALDLACGVGGNALFLASQGLYTSAWDISTEAIKQLQDHANEAGVTIETRVCDVTQTVPAANSFDVIVVSYFLERSLLPELIKALSPGGLLFYQTFVRERTDDSGPRNNDYRLARNELLHLCKELTIRVYHEEGTTGNTDRGLRNEALLIGQKNR
ncbi:MAG TPA: class I SAM-dependent methyltransferase [Gammaproteobacteria bacterium]|nr:class I SAM-dependent methyltransferase [Gammaproteobacteria bacterium]